MVVTLISFNCLEPMDTSGRAFWSPALHRLARMYNDARSGYIWKDTFKRYRTIDNETWFLLYLGDNVAVQLWLCITCTCSCTDFFIIQYIVYTLYTPVFLYTLTYTFYWEPWEHWETCSKCLELIAHHIPWGSHQGAPSVKPTKSKGKGQHG